MPEDFIIAIPVYEGVDLLDIASPFEIFGWMADAWDERKVKVFIVAETKDNITTRDGFLMVPHKTYEEVPKVDLLWVPGGDPPALVRQMRDKKYTKFIQSRSKTAEYVTSVCEGALIAASAGLLDGYEATTHWAFINCLKKFDNVTVVPGYPRFHHDENRVTGGGISSGMDEALYLVKIIAGEEIAKRIQRLTQYFPDPPVDGSLPDHPPECPLNDQIPVKNK